MSVLKLQPSDAQSDENLSLNYQPEWSAMRTGRTGLPVYHYAVISDSGKLYETEVLLGDGQIWGYCACPSRVICRHLKTVLADVLERNPNLGMETEQAS